MCMTIAARGYSGELDNVWTIVDNVYVVACTCMGLSSGCQVVVHSPADRDGTTQELSRFGS